MEAVASGKSRNSRQSKKSSIRKSLDVKGKRVLSGPSSPLSKTHLLLVNGAGHEAFQGDFFALLRFFEQQVSPLFEGEFWTVEDPFAHMRQNNRQDIKFEDQVVFSQSNRRQRGYTYVDPSEVLARFWDWLAIRQDATSSQYAREGDSIILIFLAHRIQKKRPDETTTPIGLKLGDDVLTAERLVQEVRKFPRNVEVNSISVSCYSGIFSSKMKADAQPNRWFLVAADEEEKSWLAPRSASNRYRNNPFTAGLVRSLGGLGTGTGTPTVQQVKDEVTKACLSQLDIARGPPPTYVTFKVNTNYMAASLLFRATADFPMMPENTSARGRVELDLSFMARYRTPPTPEPSSVALASNVIYQQVEAFGTGPSSAMSEGYFESAARSVCRGLTRDVPDVLRCLLWRARYQSCVFQVFMQLVLHGHCALTSLERPVDYHEAPSPLVKWIRRALLVFNGLHPLLGEGSHHVPGLENPSTTWQEFEVPLLWLAIMIARSATNLPNVLDFIDQTRHLGAVHRDWLATLPDLPPSTPIPEPGASSNPSFPGTGYIAIMLPSHVHLADPDSSFQAIHNRFYKSMDDLEQAYEFFFQ
ncbi:MAG: hypothetical protein LQ352_008329, partial [Teloschistes flavicans]